MNVSIINPNELSFASVLKHRDELHVIKFSNGVPVMEDISLDNLEDSVVIRITKEVCDELAKVKEDIPIKVESSPDKKRDKFRKTYEKLTYKYSGFSFDEQIRVDSKPDGSIRVSFKEKADAQEYRDYFCEHFYSSVNGVDAITIGSIYKDLKQVNMKGEPLFDEDACKNWGYVSQKNGICKYISDVTKTVGLDMFGFTLRRPEKLYGKTKENALA